MSNANKLVASPEETPVDDVRRIRERRHLEANGDISVLAEQSRAVVEKFREKLNLKVTPPPKRDARLDGTSG